MGEMLKILDKCFTDKFLECEREFGPSNKAAILERRLRNVAEYVGNKKISRSQIHGAHMFLRKNLDFDMLERFVEGQARIQDLFDSRKRGISGWVSAEKREVLLREGQKSIESRILPLPGPLEVKTHKDLKIFELRKKEKTDDEPDLVTEHFGGSFFCLYEDVDTNEEDEVEANEEEGFNQAGHSMDIDKDYSSEDDETNARAALFSTGGVNVSDTETVEAKDEEREIETRHFRTPTSKKRKPSRLSESYGPPLSPSIRPVYVRPSPRDRVTCESPTNFEEKRKEYKAQKAMLREKLQLEKSRLEENEALRSQRLVAAVQQRKEQATKICEQVDSSDDREVSATHSTYGQVRTLKTEDIQFPSPLSTHTVEMYPHVFGTAQRRESTRYTEIVPSVILPGLKLSIHSAMGGIETSNYVLDSKVVVNGRVSLLQVKQKLSSLEKGDYSCFAQFATPPPPNSDSVGKYVHAYLSYYHLLSCSDTVFTCSNNFEQTPNFLYLLTFQQILDLFGIYQPSSYPLLTSLVFIVSKVAIQNDTAAIPRTEEDVMRQEARQKAEALDPNDFARPIDYEQAFKIVAAGTPVEDIPQKLFKVNAEEEDEWT